MIKGVGVCDVVVTWGTRKGGRVKGCGIWNARPPGSPEETERKGRKAEGPSLSLGVFAHLSAQLGRVLSSQRGPWKPEAQRQEEVPGLFTQVPPLRHGAGERRL